MGYSLEQQSASLFGNIFVFGLHNLDAKILYDKKILALLHIHVIGL